MADAGERLGQRGGVLAEPVGDPVQVPCAGHDDPAGEGAVDERADRATFGQRLIRPSRAPLAAAAGREVRLGDDPRAEPAPASTPSPTAATTPETSWPIVTGGTLRNSSASMCRSVPQTPAPRTSSSTSPAPGVARSSRSAMADVARGPGASFGETPSSRAERIAACDGGGVASDSRDAPRSARPKAGPRAGADPDLARVRVVGDEVPVDLDAEPRPGRQRR